MKKLFIPLLLLFCALNIHAQGELFYWFNEDNISISGTNLSPNGKYAIGVNLKSRPYGGFSFSGYSSFLWDLEKDEKQWMTVADETRLEETGYFTDVNDSSTIVGYFKDPDYKITFTENGHTATMPINVAAVWSKGKVTSLGIGNLSLDKCKVFTDGTVATAISNNGKIIIGNYQIGSKTVPCLWELDAEGKWIYKELPLSDGTAIGGTANDISADGSVIVGEMKFAGAKILPVYWKNGEMHIIEGVGDEVQYFKKQSKATSVSPNGEYISVLFGKKEPAVYSVSKKTYVKPKKPEDAKGVEYAAVADNGNLIFALNYGHILDPKGMYSRPMWYAHQGGNALLDFDDYMSLFAPGVTPPFSFKFEDAPIIYTTAISADGSVVLGSKYASFASSEISTWVLRTSEKGAAVLESPLEVTAELIGLKQVKVAWNMPKPKESNYTIKSFNILAGGKKTGTVNYDAAQTSYAYIDEAAEAGYVKYSIYAVYEDDENQNLIESPKSNMARVAVPDNFDLPLFDNFDAKAGWEENYWTFSKEVENDAILDYWGLYKYLGFADFCGVAPIRTDQLYSTSANSRPIDATDADDVHVSFLATYMLEGGKYDLTKDTFSIDVSTDLGKTWINVNSYIPDKFSYYYTFWSEDITKYVSGKIFRVRMRAHGTGTAKITYKIDNFSVSQSKCKAPEGLMALNVEGEGRKIMWKNSNGAYELNYLANRYGNIKGKAVGNEGKEIMAANLYDKAFLAPYSGKYLTAVTTAINHYESEDTPSTKDTRASVLVYVDNKLILEQEVEDVVYNKDFVVILKDPIKIDATKEMKIAVKVFDYDAHQVPLLYHNNFFFSITGKSDLYSEDGGKTWKTLKEAFAEAENPDDGLGSWRISGNVTDESTITPDAAFNDSIIAYNVYCNGEKLNRDMIYSLQANYVDPKPTTVAEYTVIAYYANGGISPVSNVYRYDGTGISDTTDGQPGVYTTYPNPVSDILYISGEMDKATLYTSDGQSVLFTTDNYLNVSGIGEGVYYLKIESASTIETKKIMIRK